MKILLLGMKSLDSIEINLNHIEDDKKTVDNIIYLLTARLARYCEVNNRDNIIGAIMFIEEKDEGIKFTKFNNSYTPTSLRYITPLLIYKDKNVKRYEQGDA